MPDHDRIFRNEYVRPLNRAGYRLNGTRKTIDQSNVPTKVRNDRRNQMLIRQLELWGWELIGNQ